MLCVVAEVTERVIGERQLSVLRDLGTTLAAASTRAAVMEGLETCLASGARDVPFAVVFLSSREGALQRVAVHDRRIRLHRPCHMSISETPPHGRWRKRPGRADPGRSGPHIRGGLQQDRQLGVAPDQPPERAASGADRVHRRRGRRRCGRLPCRGAESVPAFIDAALQGFIELLAGQMSAALGNARAYEAERRRAEALAELDRAKTTFFQCKSRTANSVDAYVESGGGVAFGAQWRSVRKTGSCSRSAHRNGFGCKSWLIPCWIFRGSRPAGFRPSYVPTELEALTEDLASTFRSAMERAGLRCRIECRPLPEPSMSIATCGKRSSSTWSRTRSSSLSRARSAWRCGAARRRVRLTVQRHGHRHSRRELPRMFERFHRVEGAQGRTHRRNRHRAGAGAGTRQAARRIDRASRARSGAARRSR